MQFPPLLHRLGFYRWRSLLAIPKPFYFWNTCQIVKNLLLALLQPAPGIWTTVPQTPTPPPQAPAGQQ